MKEKDQPIIAFFRAVNYFRRGCSMKELAELLAVSVKTAYRYKERAENIGFLLEKNSATNRYKLASKHSPGLNLSFSQQEVDVILKGLKGKSDLLQRIKNKVYIHSDLQYVPGKLLEIEFGQNIKLLQKAITKKNRVLLKNYNSANSNSLRDIVTEPVIMQDYYQRLYGYSPGKKKMMQYKTERIGQVEILPQRQMFTDRHIKNPKTDLFWWVFDEESYSIRLELTRGAYHMVREEFPRIQACTREKEEGVFELETEVASLKAVSSLILRYPGEIRVLSPRELEEFTAHRLAELPFLKKYFKPLSQNDNTGR